jgi:hypothetical protein
LVVDEAAEILFQDGIGSFRLAIGLGMESCRQVLFNSQGLMYACVKRAVNMTPLSATTSSSRPCNANTLDMNRETVSSASISLVVGMKWVTFAMRLTAAKIDVNPLDAGNWTIKPIDMEDQDASWTGND